MAICDTWPPLLRMLLLLCVKLPSKGNVILRYDRELKIDQYLSSIQHADYCGIMWTTASTSPVHEIVVPRRLILLELSQEFEPDVAGPQVAFAQDAPPCLLKR